MAIVVRYVNTASTAGGDGTTSATTGSARAYATLGEWQTQEITDLVSDGDIAKVICLGGISSETITITGWTTDSSNYIWITVDEASRSLGQFGDGFKLQGAVNFGSVIGVAQDYTILEYIEAENTNTSSANAIASSGSNQIFYGCLGMADDNAFTIGAGTFPVFIACVGVCVNGGGFRSQNFDDAEYYACTAGNSADGFERDGTSGTDPILRGNAAFGNSNLDYQKDSTNWGTGTDFNGSEDSSAPGTTTVQTLTSDDFTDSANDDFSIADTDSDLYLAGEDLESVMAALDRTNYTIPREGVNQVARPSGSAWSLGAFEFLATGPTIIEKNVSTTLPRVALTAVTLGQRRENDGGKSYTCVTAGTTDAGGGPTGTGTGITDGSVVWDFSHIIDYATPALFMAALPADLVAADELWRALHWNDEIIVSTWTHSGHTEDSTRYTDYTAAPGEGYFDNGGVPNNPHRVDAAFGVLIDGVFSLRNAFTRMSKIMMTQAGTPFSNVLFDFVGNKINNCIFQKTGSGAGDVILCRSDMVFENVSALDLSTHGATNGFSLASSGGNEELRSCLAYTSNATNTGFGVEKAAGAVLIKNTTIMGFDTAIEDTGTFDAGTDFNATDDTTLPVGSNNQTSLVIADQFVDVTPASLDLRPFSGGSLGLNATPDLLTDTVGVTRDVSTPTIGPVETVVTAALIATGNAILGNIVVSGTAVAEITATGNAILDNVTATGTATAEITATGSASLGNVTVVATAFAGLVATGNAILGDVLTSGFASVEVTATGTATLGNVEASGTAFTGLTATGNAILGNVEATGLAVSSITATGSVDLGPVTVIGFAHIITATPGGRILIIPAENRELLIAEENRELIIPIENRELVIN